MRRWTRQVSLAHAIGSGDVLASPLPYLLAMWRRTPKPIEEQVRRGLRDSAAGWWVRLVLDAFGYLESDFGYALVEVRMHFKGNYIKYRGPVFDFVITFDPDATRSIGAELWVWADIERGAHPRAFAVNRLLQARDPAFGVPETMPAQLGRSNVSEAVATWARGLRELAPDVLAGAWPDEVEAHYLW